MQDFFAFLFELRADTMQLLTAALGDARLQELLAERAVMDTAQACTYAGVHINEYLANIDEAMR